MMCYRDRSFCAASDYCANKACDRNATPAVHAAAEKWWGKPGAPITFADFSPDCGVFQDMRTK